MIWYNTVFSSLSSVLATEAYEFSQKEILVKICLMLFVQKFMEIFFLFEVVGDSIPDINQRNDCAMYCSMLASVSFLSAPAAKLRGVTHLWSHALIWLRNHSE